MILVVASSEYSYSFPTPASTRVITTHASTRVITTRGPAMIISYNHCWVGSDFESRFGSRFLKKFTVRFGYTSKKQNCKKALGRKIFFILYSKNLFDLYYFYKIRIKVVN